MTALTAGRLAALYPSVANTNVTLYTVPTGRRASFSVCICNQGTAVANIKLALCTSTPVQNQDWIECGRSVATSGGVLERTGLALSAGQILIVQTNKATVSFVVYGIEEDAT